MNTRDPRDVLEKLKRLPPQQQAQVEDFVDFLASRSQREAAADRLFDMMQKLAALTPVLTEEEIDAEVAAARASRR